MKRDAGRCPTGDGRASKKFAGATRTRPEVVDRHPPLREKRAQKSAAFADGTGRENR
jgi:hypothetical protein